MSLPKQTNWRRVMYSRNIVLMFWRSALFIPCLISECTCAWGRKCLLSAFGPWRVEGKAVYSCVCVCSRTKPGLISLRHFSSNQIHIRYLILERNCSESCVRWYIFFCSIHHLCPVLQTVFLTASSSVYRPFLPILKTYHRLLQTKYNFQFIT